jgi:IclR family KDG regulon transcriptional repressor
MTKENMKNPEDYNVRAVERALQILECFDDEHSERGISEISQAVGLHKATAHRIVTTLSNFGYLERASDGQKYRLGIQLATLGSRVMNRMDLRSEALPYMQELVRQWDEVCDLSIFDQGLVFYIEVLQDNHALKISASVGQALPAHCTASGKMFLAHLPSNELEKYLSQPLVSHTENTISSPDELRKRLKEIRKLGYAIDHEEFEEGVSSVAAPIRNTQGQVVAVLSMPGPTNRMTADRLTEIAKSLVTAAQDISNKLGWRLEGD